MMIYRKPTPIADYNSISTKIEDTYHWSGHSLAYFTWPLTIEGPQQCSLGRRDA